MNLHFYVGQQVWPHTINRYHLVNPIGISRTRKLITEFNEKNENRVISTFV